MIGMDPAEGIHVLPMIAQLPQKSLCKGGEAKAHGPRLKAELESVGVLVVLQLVWHDSLFHAHIFEDVVLPSIFDGIVKVRSYVTPAKAGVRNPLITLDSRVYTFAGMTPVNTLGLFTIASILWI